MPVNRVLPVVNVISGEEVLEVTLDAAKKRRAEVLALKESGMSVRKIAKKLDLSRQRIHVILKRAREDRHV